MSAIDEMYEKYKVSQMYLGREECGENRDGYPIWGGKKYFKTLEDADRANYTVLDDEPEYPPFTAEKQLELIKLISTNKIGKNYKILEIDKDEIEDLFYLSLSDRDDRCKSIYVSDKDFPQALAQLAITLLKTGNLDKEKVKDILEK